METGHHFFDGREAGYLARSAASIATIVPAFGTFTSNGSAWSA